MPSIKSFTLTYDALNESSTFSEGDTITGKVTLALFKETTIESLFVKAKGDANVRWTERRHRDKTYTCTDHRRYFKLKQFLVPEESSGTVLHQGNHVFNFSLKIPTQSMPSTFRGSHGKIVYCLEAKLSRSWKMDTTTAKEIHFISKAFPNLQALMGPQVGSTEKDVGFFSKGHAYMDVTVNKGAFAAGETVVIVAKVNNSSSSEMTPKFKLSQKIVYSAHSNSKYETNLVHKVVEDRINPQSQKEIRCAMKIPSNQTLTINNCDCISVTYQLKVYLDISFEFDPKVVFPVFIIPPELASGCQNSVAPYPDGASGGPSNSDFRPSAVFMGPHPDSPHSHTYGYPGVQRYPTPPPAYRGISPVYPGPAGVYSSQPAPMAVRYNNPVPQGASPYGDPFSAPSSTLHPPPRAPAFLPPPSAPSAPPIQPSPSSQSPSAPSYHLLPSTPMMNMDFLSESDEPPPSYSLLFPSSTPDTSGAK